MNCRTLNRKTAWGDVQITTTEANAAESKPCTHVERAGHGVHVQQGIVGYAVPICVDVNVTGQSCKQTQRITSLHFLTR
jgi:hypothetical protein